MERVLQVKLLFTGFEPFGGESINPSWEAVKLLPEEIGGAQIFRVCLPVEYQGAARRAQEEFSRLRPDAVVSVGQAGGRRGLTLERVAINVDDAAVPDNAGVLLRDTTIRRGAANAYFATLPLRQLEGALGAAGLEAHVSNSAGTYVCNHLMFSMLDYISVRMLDVRAGFVHVPYIASQCRNRPDVPYMELEDIARGLTVIARSLAGQARV